MKILMVIDSLDKGGKERRMLELVKGLITRNEGFDIYLVSLTDRVEYNYVYELPIRFEIIKRKYKKDFSIPFKLKKIISGFKPDIIHSWSTMASVYLSVSNLFSRIPLINAVLADAPWKLNLFNKHYFRVKITTPFSDLFVANSNAGIISYRTPKTRSVCIYNGIDFSRFENLPVKKDVKTELLGEDEDKKFVVAMVATFSEKKDFETLLGSAIKLCMNNTDYVFLLIGSGHTMEKLKDRVPKHILNKRQIIFMGKRNDVESLLQIIDVGVLMTNAQLHGEGISNSIIEYMASGKPVIASRGGGTDEVVKDDFNGYLIDPGSEEQLTGRIQDFYADRERMRTMGDNARQYALDHFALGDKTEEYIDVYRKLSGKSSQGKFKIL